MHAYVHMSSPGLTPNVLNYFISFFLKFLFKDGYIETIDLIFNEKQIQVKKFYQRIGKSVHKNTFGLDEEDIILVKKPLNKSVEEKPENSTSIPIPSDLRDFGLDLLEK